MEIRGQEEVVDPTGYVLKHMEISSTLRLLGSNLSALNKWDKQ